MNSHNVLLGTTYFPLPFRVVNYYVADAENRIVCECATHVIAADLAEFLNRDLKDS